MSRAMWLSRGSEARRSFGLWIAGALCGLAASAGAASPTIADAPSAATTAVDSTADSAAARAADAFVWGTPLPDVRRAALLEASAGPQIAALEVGDELPADDLARGPTDRPGRASRSVGEPESGRIEGAVELPARAPGLHRLRIVGKRETGWGTAALVGLVLRTAAHLQTLADHDAVPLRVGNLSLREGGDLRWSHSHRAGRDVDLAFYALDYRGRPVVIDDFVRFDAEGAARHRGVRLRFDVVRNWHLVRALLEDERVAVQHIFVAEPLRGLLLDHARATGEPEVLIQRGRVVLSEPAFAGAHDDHFHVRIYCSGAEIVAGCIDTGPRWVWVERFDRAVALHVDRAIAALGEPDAELRRRAIGVLAALHGDDRRATDALVFAAAHDDEAELRADAHAVLARHRSSWALPALVRAAGQMTDAERTVALLHTVLAVAHAEHAPTLLGMLGADCAGFAARIGLAERSRLRAEIARTIRPWFIEAAGAPLLGVLADADVTTRRAALRTLEVLANRTFRSGDEAVAWHERAGSLGRLQWMYEGFALARVPVHGPPDVVVPELVELLSGRDQVLAANAEVLLRRMVGGPDTENVETPLRTQRAWARWWQVHGKRYQWASDCAVAGGGGR